MGYYGNERGYPRGGRQGERRDRDERGYGYDRERERGGTPYGGYGHTDYGRGRDAQRDQGRPSRSSGYDYDDRGFFDRAGDEVRSWFGDEEAERRREMDARYDERQYGSRDHRYQGNRGGDPGYHDWRSRQIEALDRDYHEYRREHQSQFDREFGSWREKRSGQRSSLQRVNEHMEVVGRDGEHIGTVDKVRGDRIVLTRTDKDAGGHHHSIPSAWIETVDDKIAVSKTADEAQLLWRDEEQRGAMFGDDSRDVEYRYTRGFIGFY